MGEMPLQLSEGRGHTIASGLAEASMASHNSISTAPFNAAVQFNGMRSSRAKMCKTAHTSARVATHSFWPMLQSRRAGSYHRASSSTGLPGAPTVLGDTIV